MDVVDGCGETPPAPGGKGRKSKIAGLPNGVKQLVKRHPIFFTISPNTP